MKSLIQSVYLTHINFINQEMRNILMMIRNYLIQKKIYDSNNSTGSMDVNASYQTVKLLTESLNMLRNFNTHRILHFYKILKIYAEIRNEINSLITQANFLELSYLDEK